MVSLISNMKICFHLNKNFPLPKAHLMWLCWTRRTSKVRVAPPSITTYSGNNAHTKVTMRIAKKQVSIEIAREVSSVRDLVWHLQYPPRRMRGGEAPWMKISFSFIMRFELFSSIFWSFLSFFFIFSLIVLSLFWSFPLVFLQCFDFSSYISSMFCFQFVHFFNVVFRFSIGFRLDIW